MTSRRWADEEDAILLAYAEINPMASAVEILEALATQGSWDRSPQGVKKRIKRMKKLGHVFPIGYAGSAGVPKPISNLTAQEIFTDKVEVRRPKLAGSVVGVQPTETQRPPGTYDEILRKLETHFIPEPTYLDPTPTAPRKDFMPEPLRHAHPSADPYTVAIVSDCHIPYHDPRYFAGFLELCGELRPKIVVLNGDVVDGKGLGSFPGAERDPIHKSDIPVGQRVMAEIRAHNRDADIFFMEGNHEQRARREMYSRLNGTPGYGWDNWLGLGDLGIKWVPEEQLLWVGDRRETGEIPLVVKHGHVVRKWATSSIRGHLIEHGYHNMPMGHVHRVGLTCKRFWDRVVWGMELGGVYDRRRKEMNYGKDMDWQPGFGLVTIDPKTGYSYPHPILIRDNGTFAFGGRVYGSRE